MIGRKDLSHPDSAALVELGALRTEIRRTSRKANLQAVRVGCWGSDAYKAALVAVFDGWIVGSSGQRQLVCFASAAEMGLLLERHVDRCRATAMQSGPEVLRVLYWTVMRRWSTRPRVRAGEGQAPKPVARAIGAAAARPAICAECADLQRDPRRASGHPGLHPASTVARQRYSPHLELMLCEHRCRTCEARWTMRSHAADPFVGWTLRRGEQAFEAPAPGSAFGAVTGEVVQREAMRRGQEGHRWDQGWQGTTRHQC